MQRFTLHYWSAPFRGQFVRAILAYAQQDWREPGDAAITELIEGPVKAMPIPFMGPPVLIDADADVSISQMPAICLYLGETFDLLPHTTAGRALSLKIINDANDVIDELTLDGGRQMWTPKRWQAFQPRLTKWMSFWEETARRHGLKKTSGFLLGTETPGVADIVTATLWTTLADRFPAIKAMLKEAASNTLALARRLYELPALAALAKQARADYGDTWSGGRIEASLRKVIGA